MAAKKSLRPTTNPTGSTRTKDTRTTSNGSKRGDFALQKRKMFPLNKPGRVEAAPGLAARARKAGTITASEEKEVDRKAAAKKR